MLPTLDTLDLRRWPPTADKSLRAWDAADEWLLSHLAEQEGLAAGSPVLLVNDAFGALAVGLLKTIEGSVPSIYSWSDSCLSHEATHRQLSRQQLQSSAVHLVPGTEMPAVHDATQNGPFKWVLIKIPKTLAGLEDQLRRLSAVIDPQTVVVAAGMSRHIHNSTLAAFERYIGPTTTSLARKKARLIFAQVQQQPATADLQPAWTAYEDEALQTPMGSYATGFSRDHLDLGSRLLIQQFKHLPAAKQVVDLGCGSGVLGLQAQHALPTAQLTYVDESYMAVAAAERNAQHWFAEQPSVLASARFMVSHCLENLPADCQPDLILCNPPFHQGHAIAEDIARQMFRQAHERLQAGGQLWVVANRHLKYLTALQRRFSKAKILASDQRFVVLVATK